MPDDSDYPPVKDLSKLDDKQKLRYQDLSNSFKEKYGKLPQFFASVPGRVNLIGEHIDYCGYSVLPMAVEQTIIIAAHVTKDDKISLSNKNPEFEDYECSVGHVIDKSFAAWYTYFLCGLQGIKDSGKAKKLHGLQCMVDGNIPKSAGLSSSSALVCCSALVIAHANGIKFTKTRLAEICAVCEHYCGTEGGGMDQSIAFMAEPGQAKLISFNPLTTTPVQLPPGVVFVVSNSCVMMHKAATCHFNVRVVESRIGAQIIAKKKNLDWQSLRKLSEIQEALKYDLKEMLSCTKEMLHPDPYTKEEICSLLEVSPQELANTSLSENTLHVEKFKLYDRVSHVFAEADRVFQFKEVCGMTSDDACQKLGGLMNESHSSCSKLYECSCEELDKLVEICLESGALGSRLTGAGWGGCAVSLVPEEILESFLDKVKSGYYLSNPELANKVEDSLFASRPGCGAFICKN